jgi:hypothetical protein
MAYRVFPFYNLGEAVGKGGANRNDDVKVVQGLLHIIFSDVRVTAVAVESGKALGLTLGKPPLPDGVCDSNLLNYIRLFQSYSSALAQDGRIDPVSGGTNFDIDPRTKSGKQYTLFMLNKTALRISKSAFVHLGGKLGINYFARLDGVPIIY